jgi:hypothetical protein
MVYFVIARLRKGFVQVVTSNFLTKELLASHEILCKSNIMKQNNKKKDREQKLFNN